VASIKKTFPYGQHQVTIETGEIARQAGGAVIVTMAETVVLVTAVAKTEAAEDQDFFPLTVNYQEKAYAAGRIPGGFFKREGRPTEKETLISRLIDRPIRPLFPKGFVNEIQIIATVISLNPEVDSDIPAMLGASAALSLTGAPFQGPIAGAKVGYIDGSFVLNPTMTQLKQSKLDLVVAGTAKAVLMVESSAQQLPEKVMLDAVIYGHEQMQVAIDNIRALAAEAGKPSWNWTAPAADPAVAEAVAKVVGDRFAEAYRVRDKQERYAKIAQLKSDVMAALASGGDGAAKEAVGNALGRLEKKVVRGQVLSGEPRIDGRDTRTVRPITIRTGVLPRTHGSALFTRGETQALVVTTLGTGRDAQIIDALTGEYRDRFMFHYNFPPYCVNETAFNLGPKRREIGHGRLARRGVEAVLPDMEKFPYVLRVVSEITESNGSSSMASVCGASLALMDAGVPILAPVAGVAMGLVKDGDRYQVLTDILGDEDHLGDMDFKVAGTEAGVTALQMDIKIQGITKEIMQVALAQAGEARLHILQQMQNSMSGHREEVSSYAPRLYTMKINPEKIRDVIGKGGAVIRAITEETGTTIDIKDDGTITIASVSGEAADAAKARIESITADVEVGKVYEGTVLKLLDFGAIVSILPGRDGLLHISQIANERVNAVADYLKEGQKVRVKVLEADEKGRVRLSMKALTAEEGGAGAAPAPRT